MYDTYSGNFQSSASAHPSARPSAAAVTVPSWPNATICAAPSIPSGTLLTVIGALVVWQVVTFARKLIKSSDHMIHGKTNTPAAAAAAAAVVEVE